MSCCSCHSSSCSACCHSGHACCDGGCCSCSSQSSSYSSLPSSSPSCSDCPMCQQERQGNEREVRLEIVAAPTLLYLPLLVDGDNVEATLSANSEPPCPPPPLQNLGPEKTPPPISTSGRSIAARHEGISKLAPECEVVRKQDAIEAAAAPPERPTSHAESQTEFRPASSNDVAVEAVPSTASVAVAVSAVPDFVAQTSAEVQTDVTHLDWVSLSSSLGAHKIQPKETLDGTTLTSAVASPISPVPDENDAVKQKDGGDSLDLLECQEEAHRTGLSEREAAAREALIGVLSQWLDETLLVTAVRSTVMALRRCESEQAGARILVEEAEHHESVALAWRAHCEAVSCWREQLEWSAKRAADYDVSLLKLSHAALEAQLRAQQEALEHKIAGERAAAMQWLMDRQRPESRSDRANGGAMDSRTKTSSQRVTSSILDAVDLSVPVHVRFARAEAAARATVGGATSVLSK